MKNIELNIEEEIRLINLLEDEIKKSEEYMQGRKDELIIRILNENIAIYKSILNKIDDKVDKIYEVRLEEEESEEVEEVDVNVDGEMWHLSVSRGE